MYGFSEEAPRPLVKLACRHRIITHPIMTLLHLFVWFQTIFSYAGRRDLLIGMFWSVDFLGSRQFIDWFGLDILHMIHELA